jgi:hypothetical protein
MKHYRVCQLNCPICKHALQTVTESQTSDSHCNRSLPFSISDQVALSRAVASSESMQYETMQHRRFVVSSESDSDDYESPIIRHSARPHANTNEAIQAAIDAQARENNRIREEVIQARLLARQVLNEIALAEEATQAQQAVLSNLSDNDPAAPLQPLLGLPVGEAPTISDTSRRQPDIYSLDDEVTEELAAVMESGYGGRGRGRGQGRGTRGRGRGRAAPLLLQEPTNATNPTPLSFTSPIAATGRPASTISSGSTHTPVTPAQPVALDFEDDSSSASHQSNSDHGQGLNPRTRAPKFAPGPAEQNAILYQLCSDVPYTHSRNGQKPCWIRHLTALKQHGLCTAIPPRYFLYCYLLLYILDIY